MLLSKGYELVERNYRTRYGEIDLILRDGECLVFVEVKLRRGTAFGDPAEAVTPRKQQTIRSIAKQYLAEREPVFDEARFDVIGIQEGGESPEVRHIEGAF
jgi:putative endonuclease